MKIWFCKMCGRSVLVEDKANFCYYDRSDQLEEVSLEDAEKMGLMYDPEMLDECEEIVKDGGFVAEFHSDIFFGPFIGDRMEVSVNRRSMTLSGFQDRIMEKVRK